MAPYVCLRNERQQGVNIFMPSIFEYQLAVWPHHSIMELLAAFLGKSAFCNIITMSYNERQPSVNRASTILDLATWIIQGQWDAANPRSTYRMPCCGKNTTYDIASAFYRWVPTESKQSLWRLSQLHSNGMHCAVPKLSFTWSVFSICPCIQLHKNACNVSHIWFFCL